MKVKLVNYLLIAIPIIFIFAIVMMTANISDEKYEKDLKENADSGMFLSYETQRENSIQKARDELDNASTESEKIIAAQKLKDLLNK